MATPSLPGPLFFSAIAALALSACDDVTPDAPPPAATPSASAPGNATDTEIEAMASRFATLPKMNVVPFRTTAHQGNAEVTVYAGGGADSAYRMIGAGTFDGRSLPVGSLLVKEMVDPSGGPPLLTVMYKKAPGYDPEHGDYWYGRLAADGTPTRQDFVGKVGFCVDCHAGASGTDRVWGPPSGTR